MQVLNNQERNNLLGLVREKLGLRNAIMIRFFLFTGVRVSELCGLKFDDVFLGNEPKRYLLVRAEIAKYKHAREIPIPDQLYPFLPEYYKSITEIDPSGPVDPGRPLFTQHKNTAAPLTPRRVQQIVRMAGELISKPDLHPHTFRHTFGTAVVRSSNTAYAQKLLGHRSLQSTQIYLHPSNDELLNAVNKI